MAVPMNMGVFLPGEPERKVGEAALSSHAAQRRGVGSLNEGDKGKKGRNTHPWKETLLATRRSEGWEGRVGSAPSSEPGEAAQWSIRVPDS